MTAHSRLSPSSAHRWMKCPGSVELCKDIPRESSVYADEGTAAHILADRCLRCHVKPAVYLGTMISIGENNFGVNADMVEAVQLYLDEITDGGSEQITVEVEVEKEVDLSWIPGLGKGTIDAVDEWNRNIFDLKYGIGVPVEIRNNPQQMLYALGRFGFTSVRTTIIQPRCAHPDGPVRTWAYSALELVDFAIEVMTAAKATMQPDAPLVPGEWCQFCPARATCPALRAEGEAAALEAFRPGTVPESLPPEQFVDLLRKARLLKTWIEAIETYAMAEALAGRTPPGFKLVASRGRRKWSATSDDVLAAVSKFGLTTDDIYETELVSPAEMDKLLKRNKKAIVPLVTVVSNGIVLVPASDPRPVARVSAEKTFQIEHEE